MSVSLPGLRRRHEPLVNRMPHTRMCPANGVDGMAIVPDAFLMEKKEEKLQSQEFAEEKCSTDWVIENSRTVEDRRAGCKGDGSTDLGISEGSLHVEVVALCWSVLKTLCFSPFATISMFSSK